MAAAGDYMSDRLTMMTVHAHPDDEAIGTGGVLAAYADQGIRTVLVTCTGGEVGEIAEPTLATPENLALIRERELMAACEILNVSQLHLLGYRDSGMAGTADNDHPESFHQANLEEAAGRLVTLIRRERPQVLITYDDNGFYGHPDHIKANQVTVAAFEAAADSSRYSEAGPPWQPLKLYYTAFPRSAILTFSRLMREAGMESPFEETVEGVEPEFGTPDEMVTTYVEVFPQIERKRRALMAHSTQMGAETFFMKIPEPIFDIAFGIETFQLVKSLVPVPKEEDDLFAGLR
jgi:mycothiol conjugate amidase Mca